MRASATKAGLQQAGGHAGVGEHLGDGERAVRDIRGMLEQDGVAGHQGGHGRTEKLPEGKIPRHDREHDTQRLVDDPRGFRRAGRMLIRQPVGAVPGIVIADGGAFLDLGTRLGDGFAHFCGDQPGEIVALQSKDAAQRPEVVRAEGG
jgi:hypothetical protein